MKRTNKYYFTNKVWAITDIVKLIGKFKGQMEHCIDIEKINQVYSFQSLLCHLFYHLYDSGIIVRSKMNEDRMHISICKHQNHMVLISFELYGKYKKMPFYVDQLFLNFNEKAIDNQYKIANHILNDTLLSHFFEFEKKSYCNH